jgi:rubrerythrin
MKAGSASAARGRHTTAKGAAVGKPRAAKKVKPQATAKDAAVGKPRAPKKVRPPAPAKRPPRRAASAPRTVEDFMRQALSMELEAAQRYAELADAMETHNNLEVAALFRRMAVIEGRHGAQIMEQMGWTTVPESRSLAPSWDGFEAPETTPGDEVHYLMQPYHALLLALANEERAERFFGNLARTATTGAVRKAARELRAEEREHVELVRAWLKKVPQPDTDWAHDPDPPVYTD